MRDRRSAPRAPFLCEVECEDTRSGERPPNPRVNDLSTTGAFIDTTVTFPVGAIVNIRFKLPTIQVAVQAEVVNPMPLMGMGLRFRDLTPAQKVAIEEVVRSSQ
jgi:PilZ domain